MENQSVEVFISHKSHDNVIADALTAALEALGIKCWIDHRDGEVHAGKAYTTAIMKAIETAKVFILVLSKSSHQSEHVLTEIDKAFGRKIAIVPYKIEEFEYNEDLRYDWEYYLCRKQWINAAGNPTDANSIEKLVSIVCGYLDKHEQINEKAGEPAAEFAATQAGVLDVSGVFTEQFIFDSPELFIQNGILEKYNGFGGAVEIPYGVTGILAGAFAGCNGLTSVTIPASVTAIGESAFAGCGGLTDIVIPDGVTAIADEVFWGCRGLQSVTLPDGLVKIGASAFSGCASLQNITVPSSCEKIGERAFRDCDGLTEFAIPKSVKRIGAGIFADCCNLTGVTVEEGNQAFRTEGNCLIRISNKTVIAGFKNSVIPHGVEKIGDSAFLGCRGLKKVVIPPGVTRISDSAFSGCCGLTSVLIPLGVSSIGDNAFLSCSSLVSITLPLGLLSIRDAAFRGCSGLTGITIPPGVTDIGRGAFAGCSGLVNIVVPAGVTGIGDDAFARCANIVSMNIPLSVTNMGDGVFYGWKDHQTILVNEEQVKRWGDGWNRHCHAKIIFRP